MLNPCTTPKPGSPRTFQERRTLRFVLSLLSLLWMAQSALAAHVLHTEKSLYRHILVYEDGGERCMAFSQRDHGTRQTCQSLTDPNMLVFPYTRLLMGALYLNPQPQRILIIGLGGGVLPMALASLYPAADMDLVEIDPAITRVAQHFFGFKPSSSRRVTEEDGRVFAKRAIKAQQHYDLILLDAFDHHYIPEHLLTQEFLTEIKTLLTPQGVLAANTFSTSQLYDHESATYEAVFGTFYNLRLENKNRIILLQRDGVPSAEVVARNAAALEAKLKPLGVGQAELLPLFSSARDWNPNARLLTDQYAPSNVLNTP